MWIVKGSLLALCLFAFEPGVLGQVVIAGGNGKLPKDWCYKAETIRPNLELSKSAHIAGRVTDGHDSPLKKSRVELRKYISQRKQTAVKVTTTDENGYFDMGTVKAGRYRFLASPTRGFQQPTNLECHGKKCDLNIALQVNSTDLPLSGCPVR
jgi:hypothetical protein